MVILSGPLSGGDFSFSRIESTALDPQSRRNLQRDSDGGSRLDIYIFRAVEMLTLQIRMVLVCLGVVDAVGVGSGPLSSRIRNHAHPLERGQPDLRLL
jgi:hypothetical protein